MAGTLKPREQFKVPPLVPQTISTQIADPKWLRFNFLEFCVKQNGWTFGAELGLWQGRTFGHLLKTCPNLHMIGVDLWEPQPDNPGPEGYEGWNHARHERCCREHAALYQDRARIIKARTVEAAVEVADASLDFVFIDADHSEQGCRADIIAWTPKLKPSGWLMGHDINWDGVRAAVDDLVPGYEIGPNVVWFRPLNPGSDWPIWKQ